MGRPCRLRGRQEDFQTPAFHPPFMVGGARHPRFGHVCVQAIRDATIDHAALHRSTVSVHPETQPSASQRNVRDSNHQGDPAIPWVSGDPHGLGNYLLLVDCTGRLIRVGKATISAELAGILDRLGTNGESWRILLERLRTGRLFGRFFASGRDRLRGIAVHFGVRSAWNLAGCPLR
jgi:hypothetical protein